MTNSINSNNTLYIVLGAQTTAQGSASPALLRRVHSAIDHAGRADLLFCGGQTNPHHRISEAEVMQAIAREQGVSDQTLYLEKQSRNTLENAIFAKRFIEDKNWSNIVIVTDHHHMTRARMVFRAVGIKADFKTAHRPPHIGTGLIKAVGYEVIALSWYAVRLLCGHHKQYK